MKLMKIVEWLNATLKPEKFHDASKNGLQLRRRGDEIDAVAFAVDGSVRSVRAAADAGAQLLVVHHGILWKGHLRDKGPAVEKVIAAARETNVALYASHLPLDAHPELGNNRGLADYFGLTDLQPAFNYHGNVIGLTGRNPQGRLIGVCSGGAGGFAAEAQRLGCDLYVTGEADWAEKIAAENLGMKMLCGGHYETETFGVKALGQALGKALGITTTFVSLLLAAFILSPASASAAAEDAEPLGFHISGAGALTLSQGGAQPGRLGGGELRVGREFSRDWMLEASAGWLENRCSLGADALWHWTGWQVYDALFGYERFDPFFTFGLKGWLNDGQVGPVVGIGAFYWLTDALALRVDASATLGLDCGCAMVYSLSIGINYAF